MSVMQFSVTDACADTQEIQLHLEPPCSMIRISGVPDSKDSE